MRCKPGQMCELIKTNRGINIGGIVETVRLCGEDERGPLWLCKAAWPMRCISKKGVMKFAVDMHCPDAWLRPILPPEQPETVTNEETAEA